MGKHRHPGIVEEVGSAVISVKPGQFVIGSFATFDNTCPHSTRPGGSVGYVGVPYGISSGNGNLRTLVRGEGFALRSCGHG